MDATLAQDLGQPEERRASVTTADEHGSTPAVRQGKRLPERSDEIEDIVDPALGDPRRPRGVGRDDDLDGPGVGVDGVDREGATQQHPRCRPADGGCHELSRAGQRGDGRGRDDEVLVGTGGLTGAHRGALVRDVAGCDADGVCRAAHRATPSALVMP